MGGLQPYDYHVFAMLGTNNLGGKYTGTSTLYRPRSATATAATKSLFGKVVVTDTNIDMNEGIVMPLSVYFCDIERV